MSTEVQFNLYDFSEETLEFLYNLPTEFPPSSHTHTPADIPDLPDLVNGTGSISVSSIETNGLTVQEDATISGVLTADDIQGNLTGNVYVNVRAGETLLKGYPVYVSGTYTSGDSSLPIVSRADASNSAKMPAVGIMDADLGTGYNGSMVISGRVSNFNTNAYNLNAELYVDSGGGFTATAPTSRAQVVARVERKDSNYGSVIVSIDSISSITSATTSDGTAQLDIASLGFNTASALTSGVGELVWNDVDGTLDLGLKGGNVTLQIGQESVTRVVNKTGANLLESQYRVVRIRSTAEGGAQGQRLAVVLAQANNDPNSVDTMGIVTENINVNQEGFITTSGVVRNINTTGSLQGETWVDGDVLYLSPTTAGGLTNVKPQAPNHTIIVGFVIYKHATQGKIYVKVDNGYEIDELHNVKITDVANNDVLKYNSTTGVWENTDSLSLSSLTIDGVTAAKVSDPVLTKLTGNGSTSLYAIDGADELINPSALIVAIDGILQEPDADYTVAGGNITFTSPLPSGSKAVVISPTNTIQVGQVTPSDGSVTSAKIVGGITLSDPIINNSLALNATSYTYGVGAASAHKTALGLNSAASLTNTDLERSINANSLNFMPPVTFFDDMDGKMAWTASNLGAGGTGPTDFDNFGSKTHGVYGLRTVATAAAGRFMFARIVTSAGYVAGARFRSCFAISDVTNCNFFLGFSWVGVGNVGLLYRSAFNSGQFTFARAMNVDYTGGTVYPFTTEVPQAGTFTSGKRYIVDLTMETLTSCRIKLYIADFNLSNWTEISNAVVTLPSTSVNVAPTFSVQTLAAEIKTLWVDWVSVEQPNFIR